MIELRKITLILGYSVFGKRGMADRISEQEQCIVELYPEAHLHPVYHADIAERYMQVVREDQGRKIVSVTDSENLILRLRRRIAEGVLDPNHVIAWWAGPPADPRPIVFCQEGWPDWWPDGLYDATFKEVAALQRARIRCVE